MENLLSRVPLVDEEQKIDLLHAPFKGHTLFIGAASVQKENMEQSKTLTVFAHLAVSSSSYQPYMGQGRSWGGQESSKVCYSDEIVQGQLSANSHRPSSRCQQVEIGARSGHSEPTKVSFSH